MVNVTVVGNINMDQVLRVDRFPLPGETRVVKGLSFLPGGKGANQAVAASRLGAKVALIGATGTDEFGDKTIENLVRNGVDTTYVRRADTVKTGMAYVMSREDGANSILSYRGANDTVSISDIDNAKDAIAGSGIILLQLGVPIKTVEYAVETAHAMNVPVFLDPAPFSGTLPKGISKLEFISPNEVELSQITGSDDGQKAINALHAMGASVVIQKAGEKGAYISEGAVVYRVEGFTDINVIDTTGAGDTFSAAFAVRWAGGAGLKDAAIFANAAGALSTTAIGAQVAMPYYDEVIKFLSARGIKM